MEDTRKAPLINHLDALCDVRGYVASSQTLRVLAAALLDNPQAHINALVEAGVLINRSAEDQWAGWHEDGNKFDIYTTARRPHVHEWRVAAQQQIHDLISGQVTVRCFCGQAVAVPNQLPIEAPE